MTEYDKKEIISELTSILEFYDEFVDLQNRCIKFEIDLSAQCPAESAKTGAWFIAKQVRQMRDDIERGYLTKF